MASRQQLGNSSKDSTFKRHLSKNQSVKLYKEKRKRHEEYAQKRTDLIKQYDQINSFEIENFQQFPLTNETLRGLKKCKYQVPTEIQQQVIGPALKGQDILGAAKTGSGKTLAFVIPILERLFCEGWSKSDGLGVLVITPTRELALQIFEVCTSVGAFHKLSMGLVIGGKDLRKEKKILNGYNIVICTPGRLLQHLDENPLLDIMNLQMLVLDEADRILDMGFQKEMNAIIEHLPLNRQTLLFSATQTKSVKDLARLSLKNPIYVSVHEHAKYATPASLEQSYIVCELHQKMDFLWSFLKNHRKQKILIFMASCKQVKYTFEVFCRMKPGISLTALYGGLHQLRRIERYKDFCQKMHVAMFATDIAARGLDFPNVNWVVQMDCPEDANTYIHRAGRTARYQTGGNSLLVLVPSEKEAMVKRMAERKIPINEIEVHPSKIASVQRKMEAFCAQDVNLKESAQRAFKSYLKSVFLMKDKTVFDINQITDPQLQEAFAKSYGLAFAPRVRFIQKRCKDSVKAVPEITAKETNMSADLNMKHSSDNEVKFNVQFSDDSDDDDLLMPKAVSFHDSTDDDVHEEKPMDNSQSIHKRVMTKAALAKKILKKQIKPVKIKFNEDGEAIEDVPRALKTELANKLAEEMSATGYSIEKAKQILDAEDAVDKSVFQMKVREKHKEKRLKLRAQRRQNAENTAPELGSDTDEEEEEEEEESIEEDGVNEEGEKNIDGDSESDEEGAESEESSKRSDDEEVPPKRRKHDDSITTTIKIGKAVNFYETLALNYLDGKDEG